MTDRNDTVTVTPVLLDRKRMAAALCLSVSTLDALCKRGCPSIRVPGTSKILFDADDVVAWLKLQQAPKDGPDAAAIHAEAQRVFGY